MVYDENKDYESYSSYESEVEAGTELKKRKKRLIEATYLDPIDRHSTDNLELLLFSEKQKEKWIKNNGEHDIQYNNLLTNLDRTKQIDMLKIQTDTRVDESEKKLIERIEAVEKNLQLEMELNDSDIQREIKKYVAIVK
jgi:hypothetical protein